MSNIERASFLVLADQRCLSHNFQKSFTVKLSLFKEKTFPLQLKIFLKLISQLTNSMLVLSLYHYLSLYLHLSLENISYSFKKEIFCQFLPT